MNHSYWQRQEPSKPLFPDIEWSKPERRDQSGALLVVGGNKLGFAGVAEAYQTALKTGVGQVKVMLPDCLKKSIPPTMIDVIFAACTPSGGLSKEALPELRAVSDWANGVLLIGDAGRNAETALAYEEFISTYKGLIIVTRDAIDLVKNNPGLLAERPDTLIIASFAQVQKLFQGVYYPKMLTFNMQLLQLVEAMHKFTTTYPCTIMTLHKDTLVIAQAGSVITQPWNNPMAIWRGTVAAEASAYALWNQTDILKAVTQSIASRSTI
ncbi:MAG: ADP-dependent NAD(P)H-hydrate dehydratase / NAD(P)H-hydrate epimerase [Patescibacteria group bacterium]|jgi:NAD(P)H-hydrate repair Nnr-like enzyme with NAD(P)H-hydrate dehydratase domain|nr:ADP-dependent NAD(P)H-hydrate dehydratase / NAD(P)H-hydrate epimerase [Patescibacteria group bacterium]